MSLPHSKLIHVGLPHENSPLVKELLDHCSSVGWSEICRKNNSRLSLLHWHRGENIYNTVTLWFAQTFKHPGSTCGVNLFCAKVVLDCKGDSIQRAFGGTWRKKRSNRNTCDSAQHLQEYTITCPHLEAVWFLLLEPASVPAPLSQWYKH